MSRVVLPGATIGVLGSGQLGRMMAIAARRMGYRIYLGAPNPEQYTRIFQNYAQSQGVTVAPEVIGSLLERYRAQNRELRACEPRDLIERARDICRYVGKPLELTPKVLDLAWTGYFGEQ